MKSILISDQPKWCAKILKGDKTIEIRRDAPKVWKDYLSGKTKVKPEPITGYIYCTKTIKPSSDYDWGEFTFDDLPKLGKVVAKFTLKEVEKIIYDHDEREEWYATLLLNELELYERSGLDYEQIDDYMNGKLGYAWHISDLQIFDEPKELSDFKHPYLSCGRYCGNNFVPSFCRLHCSHNTDPERLNVWCDRNDKWRQPITKAPQSWCYVEVEA